MKLIAGSYIHSHAQSRKKRNNGIKLVFFTQSTLEICGLLKLVFTGIDFGASSSLTLKGRNMSGPLGYWGSNAHLPLKVNT